jgi:hypothetical protein
VTMDVQLPQAISRIVFRCSEQTKTELVSKMQIHEGSMLTDELLQQARETAREIDPMAGPAPLISPAVDAVRRWKYQPTRLNGRPVEVETTVDVPFPAEK